MKKTLIALVVIILLGSVLRLYRLGEVPVGLHRDEAFLGYNAYSILKTGREMTGEAMPLHLRSFLYSPAGYTFAAIPAVAFFGLTPFAVRLPSAIAGILTIVAVYVLTRKLFQPVALLSALFLAISPWHINLSRTATENTIVVLLLTIALYVYLQNRRILSILLFASTYLFYQAPRAFVPLLVPLLFLHGWKQMRTRYIPIILMTVILIYLPVLIIVVSPQLSLRIRTVSIFSSQGTQLAIDESLREDTIAKTNPLVARMFHNKPVAYTQEVAKNYFRHFSYEFLLTDAGLPDRYRVPGRGLMYPVELLFAIFGAYIIIIKYPKRALLLLGWIALAPVGSALTSDDVPNLQRTLMLFPALSIVTAFGAYHMRKLLPVIAALLLYSFVAYIHAYYVQQVYHRPWFRHEGYKQLVEEVNRRLTNYEKTVITNHESSPTIFFLFYNRTDPRMIQEIWQQDKAADLNTLSYDQYEFSKEACPSLTGKPNVLYIDFTECKPKPNQQILSTIRRFDGSEVFRLLEIKP